MGLDYLALPGGFGPFADEGYDFTPFFEYTVIHLAPLLLLLVFGTPRLIELVRVKSNPSRSWLYWSQMVVVLLAAVNAFVQTALLGVRDAESLEFFSVCFYTAFLIVYCIPLHHFEYIGSRRPSFILTFFWIFHAISLIIIVRTTAVMGENDRDTFWLRVVDLVLSCVLSGLLFFHKKQSEYISIGEEMNPCPETYSNLFSALTFSWLNDIISRGYREPLNSSDLWDLPPEYKAKYLGDTFYNYWEKEKKKKNPSVLKALAYSYGGPFMVAAIFKLIQDILQFVQPLLLNQMISFVMNQNQDDTYGYLIAVAMFLAACTQSLFLHQYFQRTFVAGMQVRGGLITAIYRKSTLLSSGARQTSTVGETVNLMSIDAQKMMDLMAYLHILWSGPLQVVLALVFLYQKLGPSTFAGVFVMLLTIPGNSWLANKMRIVQKAQMKNKDSRIKLMDEILSGIKLIKLYAWESPFLGKVFNIRNQELENLKKIGYYSAWQSFAWSCTPFMVSFATFTLFAFVGSTPLTSEVVFVSLSLFSLLQFPLAMFPSVITSVVEASVSLGRLQKFLTAEELDLDAVQHEPLDRLDAVNGESKADAPVVVSVKDGFFSWETKGSYILEDINLQTSLGQLTAIVGRVGSGKSSLISSLLGEMYKKQSSSVLLRGNVAYVSQNAWILNATLKENILFGQPYNETFYRTVIGACALTPDIAILPAGDETQIGERGINLSGGQKMRVALARAVYSNADIYLLDDPLAAVDAHVGRHIYDTVLGRNGLLNKKARVLVTNGIRFVVDADEICYMLNGKISQRGTYNELSSVSGDFQNLVTESMREVEKEEAAEDDAQDAGDEHRPQDPAGGAGEDGIRRRANKPESKESLDNGATSGPASGDKGKSKSAKSLEAQTGADVGEKDGEKKKPSGQLMTKEDSVQGAVSWKVYASYGKSMGWFNLSIYLVLSVIAQASTVGSNFWLEFWSSENNKVTDADNEDKNDNLPFYLGIYGALGVFYALLVVIQVIYLWVFCAIRSAKQLHSNMLHRVVRSPMSFFDTTPVGRILNRHSRDIETVDLVLPRTVHAYFRTMLGVISTLLVISYTTPWFLLAVVPMMLLFGFIQRYYLCSSRELKRLDSVSKSPIFAHFSESLAGMTTIRAYGARGRFEEENINRLDLNQMCYYPSISANRWLAIRLEFLGSCIIFAAAFFAVIQRRGDPGLVGLSIAYALSITQGLSWGVRMSCDLETNIISVERVMEYAELPSEAPEILADQRPPIGWPEEGKVVFNNYSTRYRAGLDLVLRDLSLQIKSGEKIGIVGRTGAGKSSLTLALFRLIESASGYISIDNRRTDVMGLFDLRSKLTIIPQDNILFFGTLRENLDPFNKATDEEMWRALESSGLKEAVEKIESKLDAPVYQGGENWSAGQRQLICLARALLRSDTKILVMDEATAAVDVETDALVQRTIRREFKNCTILTIAHRLNTVMDNDRILVLDKGLVAEFDTPANLIASPNSIFRSLAVEAGLA